MNEQLSDSAPGTAIDSAAVWGAFQSQLRGFVRRRVPSDQDADDLVQEVFTRIHARRCDANEIDDMGAWLFRVTRNVIADHHRANAKQERMEDRLAAAPGAVDGQDEPRDGREPGAELSQCLRPFVDTLPEPYAEALRLTDLGGMSQTEAAKQLGVSVSGMKSRVQRGRAKLRAMVVNCCDVELDARSRVVDFAPRRRDDGCGC